MNHRLSFLATLFLLLLAAAPMAAQCSFDVPVTVSPVVQNNVYCAGDTATLTTDTGLDSYQWYYNFSDSNTNGTIIAGATSHVFEVDISAWGFAYFYVVGTKNGCSEPSTPVIIDSWAFLPPAISHDPESNFCNGDSTEIMIAFGGFVNFQWFQDGEPIAGATESNYWVKESGTYVIFASPAVCPEIVLNSGVGPTFTFVGPAVPVVTQQGTMLSATSGPNFQWQLNGQNIPGATSATYTPIENGNYRVRVTDGSGCAVFSAPFAFTITSTDEASPLTKLKVYPTPSWATVWVDPGNLKVLSVQLFDAGGKLCLTEKAPAEGVFALDLYELNSGWYWCALQTDAGMVYRQVVKM